MESAPLMMVLFPKLLNQPKALHWPVESEKKSPQRHERPPGLKRDVKRTTSPVSIAEAASLADQEGPRKRRMFSTGKASSSFGPLERPNRNPSLSRLDVIGTPTPVFPQDREYNVPPGPPSVWLSQESHDDTLEAMTPSKASSVYGTYLDDDVDPQILSPKSDVTQGEYSSKGGAPEIDASEEDQVMTAWHDLAENSSMTPTLDNDIEESFSTLQQPTRPRPMVLDITAAQDASLPSPSLSPVTAAATLQSRREYFEQPSSGNTQPNIGSMNVRRSSRVPHPAKQSSTSVKRSFENAQNTEQYKGLDSASTTTNGTSSAHPLMSLPNMVDTFEALPEQVKSYLAYQLLRRCSKPVLHFIANVVNPALKCDFLRLLPVELCINIISNLDVRSLCRAAQVSKRWRQLIDSSETVWKRLFDADKYVLPDGELQRAVDEGWGWQYASQFSDFEEDLSEPASRSPDGDISVSSLVHNEHYLSDTIGASNSGSSASQATRTKRKAKAKSKPPSRKKQAPCHNGSRTTVDLNQKVPIDLASAEGPYAVAQQAAMRVPAPHIGLPSLEHLHLFKSIYMRHHIIRRTWMSDDVAPRHIAFRAHQRHVVTCLQFDTDKILSGSDDTNINVYDTKTGALRARLEGHEGGVWALQYEGNVLVSGSTDRTVRVWDIVSGRCRQKLQGHTSTVRCLQILMPSVVGKTHEGQSVLMPKQPLIITGSRDSTLRIWKLPKPKDPEYLPDPNESAESPYHVRTLTGHHHSVRALAAHGDTLVSGSYDCSVRVWRISTGETVHRLNGHSQKVYSVVLDVKRNRCISGSMDNFVKVWSLESGSVLFNLEGHSSLVGLLDLQQDRLVSAAADSTLRVWDPESGLCKSTLKAHTGAITCFQHDGQKVISGSDRTLKMWNVVDGMFAKDLLTELSGVWQVKFNERRCVAAVQRNQLTYIEVRSIIS